jgi:simple sugar transport system permease protein
VGRTIILALVVSGAFAGLAGAVEVLGTRGRLIEGFSPGYGFEAIAIALLGGLNPFGIAVAATLFGALDAGGAGLQASGSGVPSAVVQLTAALAVIYVLIALGLLTARDRRRQAQDALDRAHAADDGAPLAGAGIARG